MLLKYITNLATLWFDTLPNLNLETDVTGMQICDHVCVSEKLATFLSSRELTNYSLQRVAAFFRQRKSG